MTHVLQIDEARDLFLHDDLIKNITTAKDMLFEDKNAKPYTLDLYANILATTNNKNPVKITSDERRWVAIQCADGHARDASYFDPLYTFLEKTSTLRGLYQGFMKRDISKIKNFQSNRPKTDYYKQCVKAYTPFPIRFLSSLAVTLLGLPPQTERVKASILSVPGRIKANKMFTMFQEWLTDGGYQCKLNATSFGTSLADLMKDGQCGLSKKQSNGIMYYFVDAPILKKFLKSRGEFDPDGADIPVKL